MKNERKKESSLHPGKGKRNSSHDDSSGDYRSGCVFFLNPESDVYQQYICTGDHYGALCAATCVYDYDDSECGAACDRIPDVRNRLWGEDGIYEYSAAGISCGV